MQNLTTKGGKTPLITKIFAGGILGGIGYGLLKLYNFVAPTIIEAATNTWLLLAYLVPLAALSVLVASNYKTIWLWYLGFCKKLSGLFIKIDPLSIMDGYLITLRRKYNNLQEVILTLEGKRVKLDRIIADKQANLKKNQQLSLAAKKQGEDASAISYAQRAVSDENTIKLYLPIQAKYQRNNAFLSELSTNWKASIDSLDYQISAKREEFETLKEMYKGLKSAEDFASSGSEEARIYGESLIALEESVSEKIAYIEDFEKRAKPIMTDMKVEKQAKEDEAMKMLEDLLKQDSIKLPDYQRFSATGAMSKVAETIPFENKYNL